MRMVEIDDMVGKTFNTIEISTSLEEMTFISSDGLKYRMYHQQECCEDVQLGEVIGDIMDMIDTPIIEAREDKQEGSLDYGTYTWTFYNFRTIKGSVTLRWVGESNGYYGEEVSIERSTVHEGK